MSIQQIRKTVLIAAGIGALGVAGLVAGRLSAGVMPGRARADFAFRMFRHLSDELDLTDAQIERVKDILKSHGAEIEAQIKASANARRTLHQAAQADPTDESAIRAAAQRLGSVQADSALLFAKVRKEVEPILSDDQKTKLKEFREKAHSRGDSAIKSFQSILEDKS